MCVIKHAFRSLVFCSLMLPLFGFGGLTCMAASCHCVDECTCVANVGQYGYFSTQWRQWPSPPTPAPVSSQSVLVPEDRVQTPLPEEAVGPDTPIAGPAVERPAVPPPSMVAPPVERPPVAPAPAAPPMAAPPVSQPQESPPPAPPLPPPEPPAETKPAPAASPDKSDSGRFTPWGGLPERALVGSATPAIHQPIGRPIQPRLGPVRRVQRASYSDPIQPWAEPRPWQKPIRPAPKPTPRPAADVPPPRQELPPGLNGFCPVQLVENENWQPGDSRWAVEHRGRIYLMSGADQQQRFLANPDRYAPVLTGNDPVLAIDESRLEPGLTEHCVVYDGRLYSFSSISTLARFRQNPKRYAAIAKGTVY